MLLHLRLLRCEKCDVLESSYAWKQLYHRSDVHNPALDADGATSAIWKELVMYDK